MSDYEEGGIDVLFFTKRHTSPIVMVTQHTECNCQRCSIIIKLCGNIPDSCACLLHVGKSAKSAIMCLRHLGYEVTRCD
jgi:hypothetical protein